MECIEHAHLDHDIHCIGPAKIAKLIPAEFYIKAILNDRISTKERAMVSRELKRRDND